MKNVYTISGSALLIHCGNATVTSSASDQDTLGQYRWRVIDGLAVTTKHSGSLEFRTTIDSVLLGVDRTVTLPRRDKNPLNAQRENIKMSPSARENVITTKGQVSYLILPNAQTVVFDSADAELVNQYTWYSLVYRGQPTIMARYNDGTGTRKVQLPRLLLGLTRQDSRSVKHRNDDRMDCRKRNLYIEDDE